ncbi:MAG: hypothetical protein OXG05_11750 [Gammaproteobacteria bacterium]|nr:hypothetical protein [Gammaproteobacteria bacterium]
MASLATGQRLKSAVCNTEIMVISAPDGDLELTCGGVPMGSDGSNESGTVDPNYANGTTIGKRYINEDGDLELLCVKPGDGSLAVNGTELKIKESKKLPKTD